MDFKVGDTVVYPRHGAATIEAINVKQMRGQEMTFLTLKVIAQDMTIQVPSDNVEMVGVRDVVDNEGLDRVFEVLKAQFTEEPANWSRRYKANQEKLGSGDVLRVAEVVRDLSRRETATIKGLSAGEKRLLANARKILISELALANNSDETVADELLNSVLAS